MANELKIRNGLIINSGGAQITGSVIATQTGFNASGIFTGDTLGGIALITTASNGFSFFTLSGTIQLYDNTNAATRFVVGSNGNIGIGTSSPNSKLHVNGTIQADGQTGIPSNPSNPGGTPTDFYGIDGGKYAGEPNAWLKINLDGVDHFIPAYR